MSVNIGRFGPYIKHKNAFYSLKKEDDPFTIEKERAIELLEAKRKADKEKVIKVFKENDSVQILNGRWGPYIAIGKKNYKIPKDKDPAALTLEDCMAIAEEAEDPKNKAKAKTRATKAKAKTKTTKTK
jgi:DNA topoisomerase I